jgi:Flp pilus assembly pilin Flp
MKLIVKFLKHRKGAALVEYALLIAGVALIGAASVSVFGHKTNDLIGTVAAVLPGAHTDDNAAIGSGHIIETAPNADGVIALNGAGIVTNNDGATNRLGLNTGLEDRAADSLLVTELGE